MPRFRRRASREPFCGCLDGRVCFPCNRFHLEIHSRSQGSFESRAENPSVRLALGGLRDGKLTERERQTSRWPTDAPATQRPRRPRPSVSAPTQSPTRHSRIPSARATRFGGRSADLLRLLSPSHCGGGQATWVAECRSLHGCPAFAHESRLRLYIFRLFVCLFCGRNTAGLTRGPFQSLESSTASLRLATSAANFEPLREVVSSLRNCRFPPRD